MGGNDTGKSITTESNGDTLIQMDGLGGASVSYKGKYIQLE